MAEELRASRQQLEAILQGVSDSILVHDAAGRLVFGNDAAAHKLGYPSSAELLRNPPAKLFQALEILDESGALLDLRTLPGRRVFRGEPAPDLLVRYRSRQTGEERWGIAKAAAVRNEAGGLLLVVHILQDITERHQIEEEQRLLADAGGLLAGSLDPPRILHSLAGLVLDRVCDGFGIDLFQDEGAGERTLMLHRDPAKMEICRRRVERFRRVRQSPGGEARLARDFESMLVPEVDREHLRRVAIDDEDFEDLVAIDPKSLVYVPLRARGRTLGVLTLGTDSSGRRFGPRDLRLAEDLARLTGLALDNAFLYQNLLEEGRRREQFLAMLAHELRNPLAPILNAVEVIRLRQGDEAAQARALDLAARQAGHMARLLDDLLDVSRITRGKIELRRGRLDLRVLVRQTVETRRPLFEARDLTLAVSLPGEPVWVDADATRLEQVLTNLLHNAAKYTDLGGRVWLAVEVPPEPAAEAGTGSVEIRVRDTGTGIPAEMLPHIFDLFSQDDRSLERSQGGLGIGLTLVRNLVELHGGSVGAFSEGPGRGSELTVRLPLAAPPEEAKSAAEPAAGRGADERRRRILLVEDNLDSAALLSELLALWGHEVRTVHDGPAALAAAAGFRPEVVLLDIGLPGMDGYEVARRLRKAEEGADGLASGRTLIAALTGYGQEADKKKAREAGFDHHFTKPVDLATLRALLGG